MAFEDYRDFLRAMIDYQRQTNPKFSFRYFSRRAGFSSPNFLKLVAEGQRNLSSRSIGRFAQAFELQGDERDAFEALVNLGQASNDEERNRYFVRLKRTAARHSRATVMEVAQFEVYSRWYALPIREMTVLPDFREDPGWISRRFRAAVSPEQARQAVELLLRTGLLERDVEGRLHPAEAKLETPQVAPLAVRNFHRAMLDHARHAIESVPADRRNVTSLTVSLTREQYDAACERIAAFRAELLEEIDEGAQGNGDRETHFIGFTVVPLTRKDVS